MRVKMKTAMAGPDRVATVGQTIEVGDEHGKDLVDGGYAELVDPPAAPPALPEELPLGDAPAAEPSPRGGRKRAGAAPENTSLTPPETAT